MRLKNFPCYEVAAERYERRGRNTIMSHYYYRIDTKLRKRVYDICKITCTCTAYVAITDKDLLPKVSPLLQPRYDCVENCHYKNYLGITINGLSWIFCATGLHKSN